MWDRVRVCKGEVRDRKRLKIGVRDSVRVRARATVRARLELFGGTVFARVSFSSSAALCSSSACSLAFWICRVRTRVRGRAVLRV